MKSTALPIRPTQIPVARRGDAARPRPRARRGFSLMELLVVIGLIGITVGMLVTVVSKVRAAAARTTCMSNLFQIGMAFKQYASGNNGRMPDPLATGNSWETSLHAYLRDPEALKCPSDSELWPTFGSSYDWRDTGDAATTMAGRAGDSTNRSDFVLAFESLPDWHAKGQINVFRYSGAAEAVDQATGLGDLTTPVR